MAEFHQRSKRTRARRPKPCDMISLSHATMSRKLGPVSAGRTMRRCIDARVTHGGFSAPSCAVYDSRWRPRSRFAQNDSLTTHAVGCRKALMLAILRIDAFASARAGVAF